MSKILNKIKNIKRRVLNMFKFNKDSGCTKVWVTLIIGGTYNYDQVPELLNLRECVKEVLIEMGMVESK
ncbi:hypothetical protein OR62_07710 [Clostridium tetani]|uniref:Uncharacterized protein n=2 Tax=Clostridium tetani TaxID=1513 RepID=A0ABC8EI69_CLOTA|nr:hypothetical protein OR62_07710 [Clostridium tetani]RXI57404.1 hypothetical protein DP131_05230 [Clostridium tetani]RXI66982.1 hypothetical protein DQN76_12615 [Clostridium tetani]BDR82565.1 hypothetical protein K234311028_p20480 [Clostridium tetani]